MYTYLVLFDQEYFNDDEINHVCDSLCSFYKNRSLRLYSNSIAVFDKYNNRFSLEDLLTDVDDVVKKQIDERKNNKINYSAFRISLEELKMQFSHLSNEIENLEKKIFND